VGVEMSFLKAVKAKIGETKQGISDMNDRRKVSNLVSYFASFPLCSESDAYTIVDSALTKYLGRSHIALINFETSSTDEISAEMAELEAVIEKERELLTIVLAEDLRKQLFTLRGSICASFFDNILKFLEDTKMEIDQDLYEEILKVMLREASSFDTYLYFASGLNADIYYGHREFKDQYFPKLFFPNLEEIAQNKLQNYNKTLKAQENPNDNSIAAALSGDQIDIGRTIDIYNREKNSWSKGLMGGASVTRMVEYYLPPRILRKKVVISIYNLSNEMKTTGDVHWHFCDEGILQVDMNGSAQPRWIVKSNIEELTFGEGYNGRSTNGVTEFEHFYLYMTVKTALGDEFTLFRFLSDNRKSAERNLHVYLNQTLLDIGDHYTVYISEDVYDISKHYETTTTYRTTYAWGEF
jgi:hypothetical protein